MITIVLVVSNMFAIGVSCRLSRYQVGVGEKQSGFNTGEGRMCKVFAIQFQQETQDSESSKSYEQFYKYSRRSAKGSWLRFGVLTLRGRLPLLYQPLPPSRLGEGLGCGAVAALSAIRFGVLTFRCIEEFFGVGSSRSV